MARAVTIRVTKAELRRRRRKLLASLPVSEEALMLQAKYFAAMTNAEWQAHRELDEIDFLLGTRESDCCS